MRRFLCCCIAAFGLSPNCWADKVLTQLEHQKTVVLKPKESLTVKLPTNPSTGYLWFLESSDTQADTLQLTQDWKFIPRDKNQRQPIGDTTWRFTAKQAGEVTLRFIYRKPWQGPEIEPLDIREYRLVVSEQG
ncbi:protease inhibitor I42 family protein [Chitinibacter fontanus]|uniref:Protease inhibitor I42 family protein n=1 Tax=Chitinibacter fontanus TaxID=1737446 RepID=A0A7D5V9G8_9NEIS|nr:protease inhibitor I42 family protein [Chitinibacter fontanus]QLI81132.1 protease inhibitor I42 family protein [Chitinibacter fontanus]